MSHECGRNGTEEDFADDLPELDPLNKRTAVRHRRQQRPDMKLYVPPKAKCGNSVVSDNDLTSAEDKACVQTKYEPILQNLSQLEITDSSHETETHKTCSSFGSNHLNDQKLDNHHIIQDMCMSSKCHNITDTKDENQINSDIRAANSETTAEESSWDSMFDENGDCLRPELVEQVNSVLSLKNTQIKLEKTRIDYMNFQYNEPELDNSEFAHVLEVYDFPIELKTQDIMAALSVFNCCRDFDIKWVDDSHALIVFSNSNAANEALKAIYPNIKLRPLSQGIRESKLKARKCSEFLRPYKQRPETSASLARRLVTGALGLRVQLSPEQRAAEKKKLQEAKERRRQAIKQGHDVWEGNVS